MTNQLIKMGIGVVGSITIDKIVREDRSFIKLGGVPTYSGITYSRHGIKSHIVTNIADQDVFIQNKLYQESIVVYRGKTEHTTSFIIHIKRNDRFLELPQRASPIKSSQIAAIIDKCSSLHFGPLHPLDIEVDALNILNNSQLTIFLDVQGYTRKVKNKKVYPHVSEHLAAWLRIAQVVKANDAELKTILNFYQTNPTDLMSQFKIHELVVTLGPMGGYVQKQNGKLFPYEAPKIKSVIDSTGAGDVFFAAYIISRYSDGKKIPDACRYASQIAAKQVAGTYISADNLSCFKQTI